MELEGRAEALSRSFILSASWPAAANCNRTTAAATRTHRLDRRSLPALSAHHEHRIASPFSCPCLRSAAADGSLFAAAASPISRPQLSLSFPPLESVHVRRQRCPLIATHPICVASAYGRVHSCAHLWRRRAQISQLQMSRWPSLWPAISRSRPLAPVLTHCLCASLVLALPSSRVSCARLRSVADLAARPIRPLPAAAASSPVSRARRLAACWSATATTE